MISFFAGPAALEKKEAGYIWKNLGAEHIDKQEDCKPHVDKGKDRIHVQSKKFRTCPEIGSKVGVDDKTRHDKENSESAQPLVDMSGNKLARHGFPDSGLSLKRIYIYMEGIEMHL